MPIKYGATIRTAKICLISFPVIFPVPRREIIKNCEKISRNHESGGHNLDTIKPTLSPCVQAHFLHFIVPFLHILGHYNLSNISNKNYTNAGQSLDTKTQIFDFGYAFRIRKKPSN